MEKAIVLLSAGLDSTVSLAYGVKTFEVILGLTINYGQKAAKKEIEHSQKILNFYGIPQEIIELPFLQKITKTSLVAECEEIPANVDLESDEATKISMAKVWVPNRNGLFINIAAAYAESLGAKYIITGFNAEEAQTFSDNSREFVEASNLALSYSTLNKVEVVSFTQNLEKAEIYRLGIELKAPLDLVWSCYYGGEEMCGKCESCLRLIRARGGK
ncbi:7-cyano-7-deazaguanine synthase QueC [Carboxydothermus pertinax]|uniref:7-cyano-7-deazaguanine synthase n=1 Tax=Carboxydothermus pertinax TaxID=870242 RepID=A0A1L8CUK0_9THEO|nr:7-cyano-7-deazaguanine synthase QueC [Carboxydothermus pertinax]GAV22519.1 7-cyano-7-deazaguanine synthase [Carboxydothermus pertinax]